MCVFSFLPPLYVFSHFSQVSTRSSCFVAMCILRCLSEGASNLHMAQSCSTDNIFGCRILPKTNMQVLILDPKKLVDYGTLEREIRERCLGYGSKCLVWQSLPLSNERTDNNRPMRKEIIVQGLNPF